jgi:hypothetical protein
MHTNMRTTHTPFVLYHACVHILLLQLGMSATGDSADPLIAAVAEAAGGGAAASAARQLLALPGDTSSGWNSAALTDALAQLQASPIACDAEEQSVQRRLAAVPWRDAAAALLLSSSGAASGSDGSGDGSSSTAVVAVSALEALRDRLHEKESLSEEVEDLPLYMQVWSTLL